VDVKGLQAELTMVVMYGYRYCHYWIDHIRLPISNL